MKYSWDQLGRMKYDATPAGGISNYYRADGQRVEKVANASLTWTLLTPTTGHYSASIGTTGASTRYFYDGTMGIEDDYTPTSSVTKVNRYGKGARGIDRIENWDGSTTTYGYPLYDGHGNMRATLAKNGSGGYSTGNWRTYDVWGSVRDGSATGDPKQRYCANLGHVADDETGLTYMRARHYEPSTGRFVSEDPGFDGKNWFVYAHNDPVLNVDPTGKVAVVVILALLGVLINMISNIDGGMQAGSGVAGMFNFMDAATHIDNSLDLEMAWGVFMVAWSDSPLSRIDSSGTLGFAVSTISIIMGYFTGGASNAFTASCLTVMFLSLTIAHSTRLLWYIADIDGGNPSGSYGSW